ncbi:o-succinylbenzoate--CoA ligase [Halobacillus locisalis]|uniref:2-succinylbenzoate--CoA ligase n=1 Tax=Halobacillus locisalis TaxID=220753 RepID=A0A838CW07_9BACI|nr:o-succinylbenzoate--CoA ligase [Halobacillus locisalis]MBA2175796.1 o-succinylbenzoate--CoA ligase [Halobacillus locisalis]
MGEKIPHWLEKQAQLNPSKTAIRFERGATLAFSELRIESRRVATSLQSKGIGKGSHIALLANNQADVPVFIHAASYVGAVLVLLNTRLTSSEIAYQLRDAEVTDVFVSQEWMDKATEARSTLPDCRQYVLEELNQSKDDGESLIEEIDLDEVFTMMYTSGTTGRPKAVMHTYGNHWYSAVASALNLGLHKDDQWLLCLPLFHVGGFSILMKSVVYGMTVECLESFDEQTIEEAIYQRGVTHVSVVTVMLQRLIEKLGHGQYPDHFRCMLLGGGPVPRHLLEQAAERNIPVFQSYGMTETSSQIATLSPGSALRKLGSAGKALSPASLVIDSEEDGEVGEILVRGPMVAKSYYNHPPSEEPFFRTGDLGYKDCEGFLYVVDRVKDVIISGGENIYPAEIESVLAGLPGVIEAGVTSRTHEKWGEVPVAFLVTEDEAVWSKETINNLIKEQVAKYKLPHAYFFVKELPRNASNKLLRRQLTSLIEGEEYGD